MPAGLRVAVPAALADVNPMSGVGKMWRHVLGGLASRPDVEVRYANPVARRARRARPDVWLSDCGMGAIPADAPLVVQVHEAGWDEPAVRETLDPHFVEVVLEGRVGDAVRAATHVITPSASARTQVLKHWRLADENVHAVPHGVDSDVFRPRRGDVGGLLAAAGGHAGVPYVLFVSQIHPRKNLGVLRDAMTLLALREFPHQLVVVGGPAQDRVDSEALDIEASADLSGYPGRVVRFREMDEDDLATLMAGAAVFCLPSLMEGFGLTALEAMSCGVPVVVSDRGALPEVVGEAGRVVPPTVEAVADAMATLLTDPSLAAAVGAAARRRAEMFSWTRTVDGWLAVLRAAAGDRRPRRFSSNRAG